MFIAPDASLDDGLLDVVGVMSLRTSRAAIPEEAANVVFKGEHVRQPNVHVQRRRPSRSLTEDRSRVIDGEPDRQIPSRSERFRRRYHVIHAQPVEQPLINAKIRRRPHRRGGSAAPPAARTACPEKL